MSTLLLLAPLMTLSILSELPPPQFQRKVLDADFRSESCAAGDLNGDGILGVVAGDRWYEGPDFSPHVFRPVVIEGGYADLRADAVEDMNGDGKPDVLSVRRNGAIQWFENAGPGDRPWRMHEVGMVPDSESAILVDLDGDGRLDVVGATEGPASTGVGDRREGVGWWRRSKDPADPWVMQSIGPDGGGPHGLATGDINRDGRLDVLTPEGWYAAPEDRVEGTWPSHPLPRKGTHHAVVYDFDGDGDQDVASSSPHDYGLWWWEQRGGDGEPTWHKHLIDDTISQLHTLAAVDLDGDGDLDLLTGKRYYAHNGKDPGAEDPALLTWYQLRRDGKEATFTRHVIDSDSGAGYSVTPVDINADGAVDILTSNKKGVKLFRNDVTPDVLPLFNGKDLSNWRGEMELWSVQGNAIVGRTDAGIKHNSFLVSRETYADFVLTLEVRLTPDSANSGIQFRSTPRDDGEVEGYQADIGAGWWGSIYEELGRALLHDGYKQRGKKAVIPGDWNLYTLYAVGDELRVEINGTVCTSIRDDKRKEGVIALQIHSGGPTEVRFRNIRLRAID